MSELNPVWIAVFISAIGIIVQAVVGYTAMKVAQAKFEERQASQGLHLGRLQNEVTNHGGLLADHAVRLGVIENEVGLRPPLDYPRRG